VIDLMAKNYFWFVAVFWLACFVPSVAAQVSSGTAFAVTPGLLITNQHVIAGCGSIEIIAADGRRTGSVVDADDQIDLALLRVGGLKGATARLRNPRNVRLGEPVMVFGFPLSGSLTSGGNFTSGLVSGLRGLRDAAGELQITAPVQPGNSGGPLLDASGLVIGVVQAKLDALRSAIATGDIPQNVNFAISLEVLAEFLAKNKIPFRDGVLGSPLDTARVAQLAQSFTYRVECRGKSQQARVSPGTKSKPSMADGLQRLNPGAVFKDCDVCPEMVVIPAGSFTMGSPASEPERISDEGPQHQVTIARQFAAGKFEVTFDEWDVCVRESGCDHNPGDSGWGRGRRPVMNVSWDDAKQYVQWLSRKTGRSYRLLTEAEWEYVARAGTTTAFSWGNSITPQQANYNTKVSYASYTGSPGRDQDAYASFDRLFEASCRQTVPVDSYAPNAFGLYDVHGNVWEWTEDCWNASYTGAPTNGNAWTGGDCGGRVLRGGSCSSSPRDLRSAVRRYTTASIRDFSFGFRVARSD